MYSLSVVLYFNIRQATIHLKILLRQYDWEIYLLPHRRKQGIVNEYLSFSTNN